MGTSAGEGRGTLSVGVDSVRPGPGEAAQGCPTPAKDLIAGSLNPVLTFLWQQRWGERYDGKPGGPAWALYRERRIWAFHNRDLLLSSARALLGWKCLHCGSPDDLCPDHIIPLCYGGTNDPSNIQPLCRSCNAKKCCSLPSPSRETASS